MSTDGRRLTVLQMLPALESGGVERGTLEVAAALVRDGHRSLVISHGGRLVAPLQQAGAEHITWNVTKRSHLFALRYVGKLRELLRRERVDIVHARSRHPAWVAWLAWRGMPAGARPRFLTTAHGLYSVNWYSAVMAKGERVIAISQTVRDYLLRSYPRHIRPENVEVIYRGVDPADYHFGYEPSPTWRAEWERMYPRLAGRPVVTLPGRLTRLKGHADFLAVMETVRREVPNVVGLIAGGAARKQSGYEQELRREVARRGLENTVLFTGHRDDLRDILAVSDVSLSLTSNPPEAFGRTVVEALSLGTPVVGYDHAGAGEILRALYPDGAVPPGDVETVARRVTALLPEAQPAIRPNTLFTEQRMVEQTLALYRRVM